MKYSETAIKDVWIIEPQRFGDARGYFMEAFKLDEFRSQTGLDITFVQDNESMSSRGVLRGLHFQINYPQDKLVRVVNGEVFDVAVDLRDGSETFGNGTALPCRRRIRNSFLFPRGLRTVSSCYPTMQNSATK